MKARDELLAKTRQRMKEQSSKWEADPNEFKVPKLQKGQESKFKFFVLAPVEAGDTVAGGVQASVGMDNWCVQVGDHWVDKRPYPCPRIYDNGDECPLCKMGFDLYKEAKDSASEDSLKAIMRDWMPQTKWWVNIYFPSNKNTPEELRDTVKWFALPKTPYSKMEACINADDVGDEDDPSAFGVFWYADENCTIPGGYLFSLEACEKGGWNDYSASKFIYGQGQVPLAVKKGTSDPDDTKIQEILGRRHDLMAKLPKRDVGALQELLKKKLGRVGTEESGFDNETKPAPTPKTVVVQKQPIASVQKPVAKPAPKPVVVEEEVEEEVAPPPPKVARPAPVVVEEEVEEEAEEVAPPPPKAKLPLKKPVAKPVEVPASDAEDAEDQEVLDIMSQIKARKK